MRKAFVPGMVLNGIAVLAAIVAFPFLLLPLMKLAFVGLVTNAPIAFLVFVAGVVLIDIGPLVGVMLSVAGRARPFAIATAIVSLGSLVALVFAMNALGLHPFTENGRSSGRAPAGCIPRTTNGTAIGRHCQADAGPAPEGDCPAAYFCMEKIVDHPETTECMVYCSHDCECPKSFKCVYQKCVR